MITEKNEDRVYVIGQHTKLVHKKHSFVLWSLLALLCLIIVVVFLGLFNKKNTNTQNTSLEEVEVISKDAIAPKFMGNQDFQRFLLWIGQNLQYPEGHETEDARVVVSFTISKGGDIKDIQIISEPQEKSFGRQVVSLLEKCPKWEPGRLADGNAIDISYTLPVRFSKTKK